MSRWPILRTCLPALCVLLSACSPALDWRELAPEGSRLRLQFPCKPSVHARKLQLAGQPVELTLLACEANAATWALGWADGVNPAYMGEALSQLRVSAAANIGAVPGTLQVRIVPGATPHEQAGRARVRGQRPDGSNVTQEVLVFAYGLRIYQATVLASRMDEAAVDQFFDSVRVAGS